MRASDSEPVIYDMAAVRGFAISSLIWGLARMLFGLLAAVQLAWPEANLGAWLHFGRIRPVHTNAVIFGFTLRVVFAGTYYGLQRLCRVRMFSDALSRIHLWSWNAILAVGAVSLLAGHTTSKEYAELEWPLDVSLAAMWVVFAINASAPWPGVARRACTWRSGSGSRPSSPLPCSTS